MSLERLLNESQGRIDYPVTCPLHTVVKNGEVTLEKTPSCYLNLKKQVFCCFGCGAKGSFIKLKMLTEGKSYEQSRRELYGDEIPPFLTEGYFEDTRSECQNPDAYYEESNLSPFDAAGEIPSRGLSAATTEKYGIRKDDEGNLYIPFRDWSGSLRGIQLRRSDSGPYGSYTHFLKFRNHRCFFGEQFPPKTETLILCEGALDALKLWQTLGIPVLAYNGSHISLEQVQRLYQYHLKRIILWWDNDKTGRDALRSNSSRLKPLVAGDVFIPNLSEKDPKDPCDTDPVRLLQLYESITWVGAEK